MGLMQETMADTLARNDATVRFEATAGEQNGPYVVDQFRVRRGPWLMKAISLAVDGTTITARFDAPLEEGDEVLTP